MRVERFHLNKSITQTEGLEPISLTRLGSVVALIGRNGSGKTRILKLLEQIFLKSINHNLVVDQSITHLPNLFSAELSALEPVTEYFRIQNRLTEINSLIASNPTDGKLLAEQAEKAQKFTTLSSGPQMRQQLQHFNNQVNSLNQKLPGLISRYVQRINYSEIHQLQAVLAESKTEGPITFESLIEKVTEQQDYNELNTIHRSALTYLAKLPHQLVYDIDDCYGDETKFHVRKSYKRFLSLKKLIKDFIGKELAWEKERGNVSLSTDGVTAQSKGTWKLDGRVFDYTKFSDGEKTLFAYCLLFFLLDQNPNIRIKESIIIIDEPELHLHPGSELALIKGIREIISEHGQLWIATHSLSILSDLSYDEIFMVKDNGIISPSKTTPGKTLIELMGLQEHIEKLSYFISNISNWAFLNFMTQCFNEPDVITSSRLNDPEVELFKQSIKTKNSGNVLLDFGAGKGRMLKELVADGSFGSSLQCFALEPDSNNAEELKKLNLKNIYSNYKELPNSTFDYVLLCNVLHEINVIDWINVLNKIKDGLKDDGYIIIIEDLQLPKGEKIAEEGFLIMDENALKELFRMPEIPSQIVASEERYKERILCALIPKQKIVGIDTDSFIAALNNLQEGCLTKIKKIRREPINDDNRLSLGRSSAFYSQLYINALLAEEKLKGEKNKEELAKLN